MNTQADTTVGSRPRHKIPEPDVKGEHILDACYRMLDAMIDRFQNSGSSRRQLLFRVADGTGLPYEWAAKFARRSMNDPGVKKVHLVHGWLLKNWKTMKP